MSNIKLRDYVVAFPDFLSLKKRRKSRVSIQSLCSFFSNGKTRSMKKLSDRQRNLLKSFLNRINTTFGDSVFYKNGAINFKTLLSEDAWHKTAKSSVPNFGRGQHNQNGLVIKKAIERLLNYIIETESEKISFEEISLITLGINVAKLCSNYVSYTEEPFQDFSNLFKEIGLSAFITEDDPVLSGRLVKNRNRKYRRDWSLYSSTYLIVEYDDVNEVKKALDRLKSRTIVGGYFSIEIPHHEGLRVDTNLTKSQLEEVESEVDSLLGDRTLIRRLVVTSKLQGRTINSMSTLLNLKDKRIDTLEDETKKLGVLLS